MLSTLVRRSALVAGLALSLLALPSVEAQSYSISKAQGNLVSPNGPQRKPAEEEALLMGTWIDSSTKALGSMSAQLFDSGGALSYHLAADVSEYIAVGPGQRFGGISGQLYLGIVPSGISVEGSWVIDEDTQEGSFDMVFFMGGQSPTVPVMMIGSASGVLTPPVSSVGGAGPVEASVMRNAIGSWISI